MQGERIVEAATNQPGMASGGFDPWEWGAWGIGVVVTTLAGLVGFFYRSIETRNAKDIAALTVINERLEKEMAEMRRSQSTMAIENAILKTENATLKEMIHNLEQRLQRYENGHGA